MSIDLELFRNAFISAFRMSQRYQRWDTNKRRTTFMHSHIYRLIADYLDLAYEYEYGPKQIDCAYFDHSIKKPSDSDIQVAIEHENNPHTIINELQKLYSNEATLRVLVTYTWDGQTGTTPTPNPNHRHEFFLEKIRKADLRDSGTEKLLIATSDLPENIDGKLDWSFFVYRNDTVTVL